MLSQYQIGVSKDKHVHFIHSKNDKYQNHLNYDDGVISGIRIVRLNPKEFKIENSKFSNLMVVHCACRFSGSFRDNDFVFTDFEIVKTEVNEFASDVIKNNYADASYLFNQDDVKKAKELVADYIKEHLPNLFWYLPNDVYTEKRIITNKSTKLAEGVALKEINKGDMSTYGECCDKISYGLFVVNGKEIKVPFFVSLIECYEDAVFDRDFKLQKPIKRVSCLRKFDSPILENQPIEPDDSDDFNYKYLPNDPDFTYEQKLSIANYLAYVGLQHTVENNNKGITGIYGEA